MSWYKSAAAKSRISIKSRVIEMQKGFGDIHTSLNFVLYFLVLRNRIFYGYIRKGLTEYLIEFDQKVEMCIDNK